MKIVFSKPSIPTSGALVVGVLANRRLTPSAKQIDHRTRGALIRAMKSSRFKGNKDQVLALVAPAGSRLDRVVAVGLGKAESLTEKNLVELGGVIYANLAMTGSGTAAVMTDEIKGCPVEAAEMAAALALGARLRSYRFDKYKTKLKAASKPSLKTLKVMCSGFNQAREAFNVSDKVADGVFLTRDLVTEPPNILYPETLAQQAKILAKLGIKVEVLGVSQMRRLGMGALLGVAQGSEREPKLVVMQWNGASKPAPKSGPGKPAGKRKSASPIAFIGKGVTFDTGGISLKPSNGMEEMKYDMGGSAVVIGLMKALAGRKAKVNAVGVVGLVENMPSGKAQRPSDIVTSMSGQTIEVLNTDAEGRLVLADALWYTKERFKPRFMIDLATLTGAIVIALGSEHAGLFSNDDELSGRITEAGKQIGEKVWRLPMGKAYDKMIQSQAADVQNISSGGRGAGSITAAQFLKRFVDDSPWAHIDIAGVAWGKQDSNVAPKGGTGFGVRLLDRLVANHYEGE